MQCLQAARSLYLQCSSPERLPESISAGLNWMENEPKEGPDLLPTIQVPAVCLPACMSNSRVTMTYRGDALTQQPAHTIPLMPCGWQRREMIDIDLG